MELVTEAPEIIPEETEPETPETVPAETEPEEAFEETTPAETETAGESSTETEPEETFEESSGETETESLEGESIPFYTYMDSEESEESVNVTDTEAIVQAIDRQTAEIQKGNLALCIGIGLLVGIVFVQGFRLRRV